MIVLDKSLGRLDVGVSTIKTIVLILIGEKKL